MNKLQQILYKRIEIGAEYEKINLKHVDYSGMDGYGNYKICFKELPYLVSIYDILYNPTSNIWEVLIPNQHKDYKWNSHVPCREYRGQSKGNRHRMGSTLSEDPIQYLYDNSPLLGQQ